MEAQRFRESLCPTEITAPTRCTWNSSPVSSSSSGGNSLESYDPQVTVTLYFEKFKYALLSEERNSLKTTSWFSRFPRRPRSKAKVSNKLKPRMTDNIAGGVSAGGISNTHPCPRSSASQPRGHQKGCKRKGRQKDGLSDLDEVIVHKCCKRKTRQKDGLSDSDEVIVLKGCKRKTRQKDELSDSDEVIVRRYVRKRGRVTRDWRKSNAIANERGKLDSLIFLHYFMHIWSTFPQDKVKSVTYFDPLWLDLYANENKAEMVLNWIKEKGVFSKKYVLVPIVMWSHWSLLIFCHLGESLHSKTNTPCMLLLDSLQAIGPTRLEPSIRRLLFDMYQSEDRLEGHKELKKMRFLIPKVPQQKKGDECGFYVLYFIKLFIESAPENFKISPASGYPYFMKKDWFSGEEVESFCRRLDALPPVFSESATAADDDADCLFVESGDDVEQIDPSEFLKGLAA